MRHIIHLFNTSVVSGPERLVLPALARFSTPFLIVNLLEERIAHLRKSDPLGEFCRSLNLPYHTVAVRGRWDRRAAKELSLLIQERDPALFHTHGPKASLYLLQAFRHGARRRFPIVSTHHGVRGLPDLKTRVYEWIYRRYWLKTFDRICSVSSADYECLLRSGIDLAKARLHLNGIDGRRIAGEERPKESRRSRALWLPSEAERDRLFLFGVVGRLSAEKDHARILQTLSGLNRLPAAREWRCLIFGSGALESRLRDMARELGLEKRVVWMGYRNTLADELSGLDLLLSFSKAEGLPINLVEAGWAGTPVMATLVGGVSDLLPDESYGIRVPLDEPTATATLQMQGLLSEKGSAKLSAQAARFQERVTQEFTQTKWMRRLEEIYSELNVSLESAALTASIPS